MGFLVGRICEKHNLTNGPGLELRKMRRRPEPARGSLLTRAVNMSPLEFKIGRFYKVVNA
ncbi:hypothetical protein EJ110_NYTH08161 [Nymphaea thermarum]|nr:hypothetical protein EJ110_NYTH08161 [Nymphaea thermarum]